MTTHSGAPLPRTKYPVIMSGPKENTVHNILPVPAVVMEIRKKEVFGVDARAAVLREGFRITMHAKMNTIILLYAAWFPPPPTYTFVRGTP